MYQPNFKAKTLIQDLAKTYAFIGVLERKQESYRAFQHLAYSERIKAFSRDASHKSNSPADLINSQQKTLILERNKLDVFLYEFANKMLNNTLKLMMERGRGENNWNLD